MIVRFNRTLTYEIEYERTEKIMDIEFDLIGDYALFSDPLTRPGGEKNSLIVPTYEALRGAIKNCFWKPTIVWIIDTVRIMNAIKTETKGQKLINYSTGGNDLAYFTYLKDVRYQVKAHYEWNENYPERSSDWNKRKYDEMIKRALDSGGRRSVFLGTKECQAEIRPCEFGSGKGYYDTAGEMALGYMYHGLTYPEEAVLQEDKGYITSRFWRPVMENGVIEFIRPEKCVDKVKIQEKEMTIFPFRSK